MYYSVVHISVVGFTTMGSGTLSPVWKFSVILFGVISLIALLLAIYGVHTAMGRFEQKLDKTKNMSQLWKEPVFLYPSYIF